MIETEKIERQMSNTDLLTIDDIAALWKVEREYAQRYLTKRPGFPDPAPGSTRKKPRWLARDIDEFLAGEREAA
jgi:hypothetical protein